MHSTLHILNGDAIQEKFQKAFPGSEHIVFREILCEGPCTYSLSDPEFFVQRRDYLKSWASVGHIEAFEKSWTHRDWNALSQIYLWFEADLFCFINLLSLLDYLSAPRFSSVSIKLMWAGHPENPIKHSNLGFYSETDFLSGIDHVRVLAPSDLNFASKLWKVWKSDNHADFGHFHDTWPLIPDYKEFLNLHIDRFASINSGLGIEEELLLSALDDGADNYQKMMRWVLQNQAKLGFGDLQFEKKFHELVQAGVALVNDDDALKISESGRAMLEGKSLYQMPERVWGHCSSKDFVRNQDQLQKRSK
jgi:hypothetical protein